MDPRQFVEEYGIRSLVCCFSGGKDSLCATHYVLSELKDVDIDKYVVLVDTTVMVPIVLKFAKEVASQFGWNFEVLYPKVSFWEYATKYGCPSMRRRWCCYLLKLQPIFDFIRPLKPQRAEITGLRRDESLRRQKMKLRQVRYDRRRNINAWQYHPILEWSEKDVLKYIERFKLPIPPHYSLGIKETCSCGVFTHKKQLQIIRSLFPDFYQKFIDLQKQMRPGSKVFFDHKPLDPQDILPCQVFKQKTLEISRGNEGVSSEC